MTGFTAQSSKFCVFSHYRPTHEYFATFFKKILKEVWIKKQRTTKVGATLTAWQYLTDVCSFKVFGTQNRICKDEGSIQKIAKNFHWKEWGCRENFNIRIFEILKRKWLIRKVSAKSFFQQNPTFWQFLCNRILLKETLFWNSNSFFFHFIARRWSI